MSPGEQDDPLGLVGTVLDAKFRIERVVAEGGFGMVYQATHLALGRMVALKVLKHPPRASAEGTDFVDGFVREARTIARLNHPYIVKLLEFGVSPMPRGERSVWMALEWLTGESLDAALKQPSRAGGVPPAEVMRLMRGAMEALAYAHEEGIAHRDVKPSNFMLETARRGAALKLLDFGIAKIMGDQVSVGSGETQTTSTNVSCSPRYAAPEQFNRGRTGPWTDVHALGLVLSEMLTGKSPYNADSIATLCFDALRIERPTPGHMNVDVGAWEPVLSRALALRPPDRYPNAGALLAALDAALPGATHVRREPAREAPTMPAPLSPNDAMARYASSPETRVTGPSQPRRVRSDASLPAVSRASAKPRRRWRARWIVASAALVACAIALVGGLWVLPWEEPEAPARRPPHPAAPAVPSATVAPAAPPEVSPDAGRPTPRFVVVIPPKPVPGGSSRGTSRASRTTDQPAMPSVTLPLALARTIPTVVPTRRQRDARRHH